MKHLLTLLALLGALSGGRSAASEGGELSIRATAGNEVGVVYHPQADYAQAHGTALYIPRFGFNLSYGCSYWLELGVGVDVSLPREVVATGVAYQGLPQGDLHADYLDIFVPLQLTLRHGSGADSSWLLALAAGPVFVHWSDRSMLADASPGAPRYPIRLESTWRTPWFARAALLFEWRPADWGALQVGPYSAYTSAGDVHGGLLVQGDLLFGFGPSF